MVYLLGEDKGSWEEVKWSSEVDKEVVAKCERKRGKSVVWEVGVEGVIYDSLEAVKSSEKPYCKRE